MNCLVIGTGSIGKRHIRNIQELGHKVFAYDIDSSAIPDSITPFYLNNLNQKDVDVVFICTPPSDHLTYANVWASKHLFIEKPLATSYENAKIFVSYRRRNQWMKIGMGACNFRFNPLIVKAKTMIEEGRIGKVHSVKSDFGYDWKQWYPDSKKREFPGVALDCTHDIDLLKWFHGEVVESRGIFRSNSNNVPSVVDASLLFKSDLTANVHMDYVRKDKVRKIEWIGEKGTLEWIDNRSRKYPHRGHVLLLDGALVPNDEICKDLNLTAAPLMWDRNYPYLKQLEHFFSCIEKEEETCNSLENALDTLRIALQLQGGVRDE